MRDAMGGTIVLVIIVVFIVFALAYMAFNVNYTKAFRMKDKIISVYDDFNGDCSSDDCKKIITDYARKIGYTTDGNLRCPAGYERINGIYCIREQIIDTNKSSSSISYIKNSGQTGISVSDIKTKHYFNIITKINLHIPVVNNILDLSFFYIYGDTKTFEVN